MRNDEQIDVAIDYIKSFIGLPYKWAGDDSIEGFDCSGLVVEFLQCVGLIAEKSDYTANDLYQMFSASKIREPRKGALVFYGYRTASHVGICINQRYMIEAGGGDSNTETREDAIKQNAFVRIRPIFRRPNTLGILDPFLQE
jgi:murein DD-endopeptidase